MRFLLPLLATAIVADAVVIAPPAAQIAQPHLGPSTERDGATYQELWKRKGGGGGGGRGGGGGSRGGGSSGRGGSSGSSSGRGGRGSPTSSAGGRTSTGSGPPPAYGRGRYYGGGAAVPYRSGGVSPSGLVPVFLAASFLAFWPGLWLAGAHLYHYHQPYHFYNQSSQQNETKPVVCGCNPYQVCSCDENGDTQYMNDLIGNGSYNALNKSVVNVADVNGTSTILINGTLPNGTTAPGGTESPNAAGGGFRGIPQLAGWAAMVAAVCAIVLIG